MSSKPEAMRPSVLRLFCDRVERRRHDWRDIAKADGHFLETSFEDCPEDPQPCPAEGCGGTIQVRPET